MTHLGRVQRFWSFIKVQEYSKSTQLLRTLEEDLLADNTTIDVILNDIFNEKNGFKSVLNILDETSQCEEVKFAMCNFLLELVIQFPYKSRQYAQSYMALAYSGYIRSKLSRLKELWLRLFRKVISRCFKTHVDLKSIELYTAQLFAKLSCRQSQSVCSAVCLSLGKLVRYNAEIQEKNLYRLKYILIQLVSDKLSESSKKIDFSVIASALSVLSKVLPLEKDKDFETNVMKCFHFAVRILTAEIEDLHQHYNVIKSACFLISQISEFLNFDILQDCNRIIFCLQNLSHHQNAQLSVAARRGFFQLLDRLCRLFNSSEERGCEPTSQFTAQLTSSLIANLNRVDVPMKQLVFSLRGLSLLARIHSFNLSQTDALHFYNRILTEVKLIMGLPSSDEAGGMVAHETGLKGFPEADRWAYSLPDLILTVANLIPVTEVLDTNDCSYQAHLLLRQLMINSFYVYPSCSLSLTKGLVHAIFGAIQHLAGSTVTKKETINYILNDVVYQAMLRTCLHSPVDDQETWSDASDEDDDEKEKRGFDGLDPTNAIEEVGSKQTKMRRSYFDYLPLWRNLLGLSTGWKSESVKQGLGKEIREPSALICNSLLTSCKAILGKLDFSYKQASFREASLSEIRVSKPQDILLLANLVAFLEHILPDCPASLFSDLIGLLILECVILIQRYPLLSGLYRLLTLAISTGCRWGIFGAIGSSSQYVCVLVPLAASLLSKLEKSTASSRTALSLDDLHVARLVCLLNLPISSILLIPVTAEHNSDTTPHRLGSILSSGIQLAASYERCSHLATIVVKSVRQWLEELRSDELFDKFFTTLIPSLSCLLYVGSSGGHQQLPVTSQTTKKNKASTVSRRRKSRLQRATNESVGKMTNAASAVSPFILEAQSGLLDLIGSSNHTFSSLTRPKQPKAEIERISSPWELLNCVMTPAAGSVFAGLSVCLPFPDIRPSLSLSDRQLLCRCLQIVLSRQSPIDENRESSVSEVSSRQAVVCAAEFLHEFIIFGLTNQVNQRARSHLAAHPPANQEDAQLWSIFFHVALILGADADPLIRQLFRDLAFQLVHWFAGYQVAGDLEANCLRNVLLDVLQLTAGEEDENNPPLTFELELDGLFCRWPLSEMVSMGRVRLAAACLRDYFEWTKRRRSRQIATNQEINPLVPASPEEALLQAPVEALLQRVCKAARESIGDELRRFSCSLVFTEVLASVLSDCQHLSQVYALELLDAFMTAVVMSPGDTKSTDEAKDALKRAVTLFTNLLDQNSKMIPLELSSQMSSPVKKPRLATILNKCLPSASEPPLSIKLPIGWQSATVFGCLEALLRFIANHHQGLDAVRHAAVRLITAFGQTMQGSGSPAKRCFNAFVNFKGGIEGINSILSNSADLESSDIDQLSVSLSRCLENYDWLVASGLFETEELKQFINSRLIASTTRFCSLVLVDQTCLSDAAKRSGRSLVAFCSSAFRLFRVAASVFLLFPETHPVWQFLTVFLIHWKSFQLDETIYAQRKCLLSALPLQCLNVIGVLACNIFVSFGIDGGRFGPPWLQALSTNNIFDRHFVEEKIKELIELVQNTRLLLTYLQDAETRSRIVTHFSEPLCRAILDTANSASNISTCQPFFLEGLRCPVLSLAIELNLSIPCGLEMLSRLIDFGYLSKQENESILHPHTILNFMGLTYESPVHSVLEGENPHQAICLIAKAFSLYAPNGSKDDSSLIDQFCDAIIGIWPSRFAIFIRGSHCDSSSKTALVDLLEKLISFSSAELNRNNLIESYLLLLNDAGLGNDTQVKLLDMLAFMLQSGSLTGLALSANRRVELCDAVKMFLVNNLPLDPVEFDKSPIRSAEFVAILRSVLSCLETTGCPEVVKMLTMIFCSHDVYFMESDLSNSLRKAMHNSWTKPQQQELLLTATFDEFCSGVDHLITNQSSQILVHSVSLWRRFSRKFLVPLILSVDVRAFEAFAKREVSASILNLESGTNDIQASDWLWKMILQNVIFMIFTGLYNRLPKAALHGNNAPILHAFLNSSSKQQQLKPKGTELTANLIKKAHTCLNDHLSLPPGCVAVDDVFSVFVDELRRDLWTSALSCLIATMSATQLNEKPYNYVLIPGLLQRLLPNDDMELRFSRQRSSTYQCVFLQIREEFWWIQDDSFASSSSSSFRFSGYQSQTQLPQTVSSSLLQESSPALELGRMCRLPGTQIMCPLDKVALRSPPPVSPIKSPTFRTPAEPPSVLFTEGIRNSSADNEGTTSKASVRLESDCINTHPVMVCFVGLLKQMHARRILPTVKNPDISQLPACMRYLFDLFNGSCTSQNLRIFIIKLILNCPEVFQPFGKLWLAPLLSYASLEPKALVDLETNSTLSSFGVDICLLFAEWADSTNERSVFPTSEAEKMSACVFLGVLLRLARIDSEAEGMGHAQQLNIELFRLLTDRWANSVSVNYGELYKELQHSSQGLRRSTFGLSLLREVLLSEAAFTPGASTGVTFANFTSSILPHLYRSQKTVLTVAWEAAGALVARCSSLPQGQSGGKEFLRSRGIDLLPLDSLSTEVHPIAIEMWSRVTDLSFTATPTKKRAGSVIVGPSPSNLIEAACLAASHWPVLSIHLTSTLIAVGVPGVEDSVLFIRCLHLFARLLQKFNQKDTGPLQLPDSVDQSFRVEILTSMLKSNVLELIIHGTPEVISAGLFLTLRMVQFGLACSDECQDFNVAPTLNRLLQTALQTLQRPNCTVESRRLIYRIFAEVITKVDVASRPDIKSLSQLVLAFGVSSEEDGSLRRLMRRYVSRNCLSSNSSSSSSCSRCLAALGLISSPPVSLTSGPEYAHFQSLVGRCLSVFLPSSLQLFLAPAVKSAEFRDPLFNWPLDPIYPFFNSSYPQFSSSSSTSLLDPAMQSSTQSLLPETSSTLALKPILVDDASEGTLAIHASGADTAALMETGIVPSTPTQSVASTVGMESQAVGEMKTSAHDFQSHEFNFQASSASQPSLNQTRKKRKFQKLSRIDVLREKFLFYLASSRSSTVISRDAQSEIRSREFFKKLTVARQRAEYSSTNAKATKSLFSSDYLLGNHPSGELARLCRRQRVGALPDIQSLTPGGFLRPLFNIVESGLGSRVFTLVVMAVYESIHIEDSLEFVSGLSGHLSTLLHFSVIPSSSSSSNLVASCLGLVWEMASRFNITPTEQYLALIPDARAIADSSLAAGLGKTGIAILEEMFCALASRSSVTDEPSQVSLWTAKTRNRFETGAQYFVLPSDVVERKPGTSDGNYDEDLLVAQVWWQLARVYRAMGDSDELLGWLNDRWTCSHINSRSGVSVLACVGSALMAKSQRDYETAFSEFSELITSYTDGDDDDDDFCDVERKEEDVEMRGERVIVWSTCPPALNSELQLICREELLTCLEQLGSWQELDELATSTASALAADPPPLSVAATSLPSTSSRTQVGQTEKDEVYCMFDSLWSNAYAVESLMPRLLRARLKTAISTEVDVYCCQVAPIVDDSFQHLKELVQSGQQSIHMGLAFESKFAYELAMFYILQNDWARAKLLCNSGFTELAQVKSEMQEFLTASSSNGFTSETAHNLLLKWRHRALAEVDIDSSSFDSVASNRLFYLAKMCSAGKLSRLKALLPVCFDFRLAIAKSCVRAGNTRQALTILTPLHRLAQTVDQSSANGCRRLAWCNAFVNIWTTVFDSEALVSAPQRSSDTGVARQLHLENGLAKGLVSISQCIELFSSLRDPPSDDASTAVLQFSHSLETGRLLSRFCTILHEADRFSDAGRRRLAAFLPTLSDRFQCLFPASTPGGENNLDLFALLFFQRCITLARGVAQTVVSTDDDDDDSLEARVQSWNVITTGPGEALLEVANFCNSRLTRLDAASTTGTDSSPTGLQLAHSFVHSVLISILLGENGGRMRFARALQLTTQFGSVEGLSTSDGVASMQISPARLTTLFCDLTRELPSWVLLQWLDNLMHGLMSVSPLETLLVSEPLQRVCENFPRYLFYAFRVSVTAILNCAVVTASKSGTSHGLTSGTFVDGLLSLMKSHSSLSRALIIEFSQKLMAYRRLDRFLSELEKFDDPDLVFKDWVASQARPILRSSTSDRTELVESCCHLLNHSFLRFPNGLFANGSDLKHSNDASSCCSRGKMLADLIRSEFDSSCQHLARITLESFEESVERISSTFSADQSGKPRVSLTDYSHWLAAPVTYNYSDDKDILEIPNEVLSSQAAQTFVSVHRFSPIVKTIASLRKPKVLRLLGSDGKWRDWLVKGEEDLRQDAHIQHLFRFTNYALSNYQPTHHHQCRTSKTDSMEQPMRVRTYQVVPVTCHLGLVQWVTRTTTLFAACKSAMTTQELALFTSESASFAGEVSDRGVGDGLWNREEAIVARFSSLERLLFSMRLLRRTLAKLAPSAEQFFQFRHRCIKTHATLSAVHYILGIGDRHLGNFLLDNFSGDVIGIDFGYAFGVTTVVLPIPELAPFRLTSSLREVLEPSGPAGQFGVTLGRTLSALRNHSHLFLSILQTFIEDESSIDWSVYGRQIGQSGEAFQNNRLTLIQKKLIGQCPAGLLVEDLRLRFGSRKWFPQIESIINKTAVYDSHSVTCCNPPEQARRLVCLATCPELLSRMHVGWHSFL